MTFVTGHAVCTIQAFEAEAVTQERFARNEFLRNASPRPLDPANLKRQFALVP